MAIAPLADCSAVGHAWHLEVAMQTLVIDLGKCGGPAKNDIITSMKSDT